ncbi:acyl-CoA dehydrogenase family protein [Steroidobacter sp. S1-65]|uniref:Acyl-CoA dehydrogenase family protein n=1 Tax=Steroidobacter gossypii TaxID=2805490 RepID=A0ABS1WWN2_9GAMM|nr:acyl-CoA dehydrogenase family protein [Steroidobacter gossypii]MBM0105396.1 acyl-CoA dehydrogenase family protein [Steroidobacter gossypii]
MDFNFSEEQQLLVDTVQRYVRDEYSFEARRDILKSPAGWSREKWQALAGLGLTALNVPEEHGGLGSGPVETMLVMNALGEGLVVEPFLPAAVMTPVLLTRIDDKAAAEQLLPDVASGERIVIVAHQEPQTRGEINHVATRAEKTSSGYVLDGVKNVILGGGAADELLVSARTAGRVGDTDGISIFRVDPKAAGVTVKDYGTIDGQRAADIELKKVAVPASSLVGAEGKAFAAIEAAHDQALSALCAEAVGIMKAVNATTLDYTKNRKQFGQPIARFQVLQHRMADMFLHSEQARSMSYLAAIRCVDSDAGERRRALSAAKAIVGQAGRFIAQQAVQLHGGMGMTEELMVSHYFKRLTAIDLTLGDADFHTQQFIAASNAA